MPFHKPHASLPAELVSDDLLNIVLVIAVFGGCCPGFVFPGFLWEWFRGINGENWVVLQSPSESNLDGVWSNEASDLERSDIFVS